MLNKFQIQFQLQFRQYPNQQIHRLFRHCSFNRSRLKRRYHSNPPNYQTIKSKQHKLYCQEQNNHCVIRLPNNRLFSHRLNHRPFKLLKSHRNQSIRFVLQKKEYRRKKNLFFPKRLIRLLFPKFIKNRQQFQRLRR
ncbi:MAG: PRD domain-containing protein [Planctomycetaceae bacterium]|nr:PRD domain-containing protein [Planctomycetaceae bacterium]